MAFKTMLASNVERRRALGVALSGAEVHWRTFSKSQQAPRGNTLFPAIMPVCAPLAAPCPSDA